VEILINSPYIADLIEKGKIDEIKEVMARSREQGMQTFDQALFDLYKEGKITRENAVMFADSKNNVGLQIRLTEGSSVEDSAGLTMKEED
jgi:twitching motility protein PilU